MLILSQKYICRYYIVTVKMSYCVTLLVLSLYKISCVHFQSCTAPCCVNHILLMVDRFRRQLHC